jgi:hypothetical protein
VGSISVVDVGPVVEEYPGLHVEALDVGGSSRVARRQAAITSMKHDIIRCYI